MGIKGAGFKFRMELDADEEGMVFSAGGGSSSGGELDDLHQVFFRIESRENKAGFF